MQSKLPVAVIGAGPVGLAAAAHLAARGEAFVVLETGASVGHSMLQWGHVRVFSPWRYNVDRTARRLLEFSGWRHPTADALPTGREIVQEYLDPLASLLAHEAGIRLRSRVIAVGRHGLDKATSAERDDRPFMLRVATDNGEEELLARAVIDASGTWCTSNPLGSGGYLVPGETSVGDLITYGIPDVLALRRNSYAGKTTLVVGSGHSATNTVLALARLAEEDKQTRIFWGVRRANTTSMFEGKATDVLEARGALRADALDAINSGRVEMLTSFKARSVTHRQDARLEVCAYHDGRQTALAVDRIVVATGFRPDFSFLKEVRLSADPSLEAASGLAPLIDPNVHSCGTVRPHGAAELAHPEKDFYIVGMKAYGRAPTFLLATGYEQVRSVVAKLTGDHEAAARVELERPRTQERSTMNTRTHGQSSSAPALIESGSFKLRADSEADA